MEQETRKAFRLSFFNEEEDRISRLPDGLIHYIYSFLDTRYAVQTSVLSKRWIGIWNSIPYLNIKRTSFPEGGEHDQGFIDIVDMVFVLRNDDSDIQRFGLQWHSSENDDDSVTKYKKRWIVHAVKRNVQEMTIDICQDHHSAYEIPHQLLTCQSVTKLEMQVMCRTIFADVILPKSMELPPLKVLRLTGLSISDVELSKRLFSSCPVLEKLEMLDCNIPRNVTVYSSSLRKFEYICSHRYLWLQNDTSENNIKLCAPNLESFLCSFFLSQDYSLEISSPLSSVGFYMKANAEIEDEKAEPYEKLCAEEKELYVRRMVKFLRAVYTVKVLILSSGFVEVLSQAPDLLDCQPPRLCNLHRLVLDMWSTRGCLRSIVYLLKISPNITRLILESKKSNLAELGDDWEAGLSSPEMLSHLEYVKIEEVEGCDAELKILSFLLKTAKVLGKLSFTFVLVMTHLID